MGDEGCYVEKGIIGTHVDDLLGIGPSKTLDQVEENMSKSVKLDKRGKPRKMLGIEIEWRKNSDKEEEVILTQTALIENLVHQHLQNPDKPSERHSVPIDPSLYEASEPTEEKADKIKFQQIVGGLLFVCRMTRPEISIHVNLLGRRASDSSPANMKGALEVLRYLWSTRSEGLLIRKPPNLEVEIYADTSYGGEEAKSQSGAMMTIGKQPIGWWSQRQDIVALSITEAEYIADCEGVKDTAWIRQLLKEMKVTLESAPMLKTDSEGAKNLSKTAKYLRRSCHIQHRFHYLREEVNCRNLHILAILGKENQADILTKITPMTTIKA